MSIPEDDPPHPRWRVGRTVGRTLYIHDGDDPDGSGRLVGLMDTVELAEYVVTVVNWYQRTHGGSERSSWRDELHRLLGDP